MGIRQVDLLGPARILHAHLTAALCETVFKTGRVTERRRIWTLHRLVEFWAAVILRAPESLRQALDEASRGAGGYPAVKSSPQAFFARSKGLRWTFFRDLFERFTARALRGRAAPFEKELRGRLAAFPEVWIVDGSGLDAVAHRLKVLWDERAVVLPGSLLVFYDLFRGLPRRLFFYEEAMGSEVGRTEAALASVKKGTLLVGDRAYGVVRLFASLAAHGAFLLARRNRSVKLRQRTRLRRVRHDGGVLEEFLVLAGSGWNGVEPQRLRLIRWQRGKKLLELVTNVLDAEALAGETALDLYRRRWSVERMFFDLKEVLNLKRFYAANVNAVAMQVYAAALVYVALRLAQAQVARDAGLAPEALSTAKLFPKVAVASHDLAVVEIALDASQQANPGVTLERPDLRRMAFASAPLASVLVETRGDKRRRRRYCAARRRHASLHRFSRKRKRR